MALPLRRHADAAASKQPAKQQPTLALAKTQRRRRWPAVLGALTIVALLAGLLGAAVFHTQLASRQLQIDALERSVNDERERFDELRRRRAELRSPVRLADEAARLGMVRGSTGEFVQIDPWMLARQIAAAGVVDNTGQQIVIDTDPLEQFSDVKRVSAGQP